MITRTKALFIFSMLFSWSVSPLVLQASSSELDSQCAELVKECFGYQQTERTNCFFSASTHPFCEGTELGKLTQKRWSMSPIKLPNQDVPGFLGPQLVDGECISGFDNKWFSQMVDGALSSEQLTQLDTTLDACKKKDAPSLPRP